MASTSGAGTGKGAAEEPEPEPGESPHTAASSAPTAAAAAAAAAASYDPREYQVHPDDRGGGGGGGDGKLTKKKKGGGGKKGAEDKAKGEGAEKEKDKGKGKEEDEEGDDGTHRCGNCDALDAKSKCKGCGVEYYCNRECQTVRARMWRMGGAPPLVHAARRCSPMASSHTTTTVTAPPCPGALEVRRPQESLPRLRRRGGGPGAAGPAVQEGARGRQVPHLPRAAGQPHHLAVRAQLLH